LLSAGGEFVGKNAVFAAALCVCLVGAVGGARAGDRSEANKRLVTDAVKMLFIDHKVDQAVDTYFAPGYIQHNPLVPTGAAPMRAFFKSFYAANPGSTVVISHVLADDDLVAVHYRFKASPEDRGMAVVDIFRVQDGKIQEHWDVAEPVPEKAANDNGMF
jgi:predicted SnoaL-like aldol condensation-catalyzing enzyme